MSLLVVGDHRPVRAICTGQMGSGKSVLLWQVAEDAQKAGWRAVLLEANAGSDTGTIIRALSRIALAGSTRVEQPGVLADTVSSRTPTYSNWTPVELRGEVIATERGNMSEPIASLATSALSDGQRGLLIALDDGHLLFKREQGLDTSLRHLLEAIVTTQAAGYPVALIAVGLPSLDVGVRSLAPRIASTFRFECLSPLDDQVIGDLLERYLASRTVLVDADQLSRMVAGCHGSPYLLQAWGSELWDFVTDNRISHLTRDEVDKVATGTLRWLDATFYLPCWAALSETAHQLLSAAAMCPYPPLRNRDVKTAWSRKGGNVDVALARLNYEGILAHVGYGEYEYTVPGFHEYLQRGLN